MAVKDYNTDPDLNTSISGINIAEGCPPSGINNAIRQLMADVKEEKVARDQAQTARDAAQDKAISDEAAARKNAVDALNESIDDEVAARESAVSALGAAVVHKSGAETIAGAKTFTDDTAIANGNPSLFLQGTGADKTVTHTSTSRFAGVGFYDKNGLDQANRVAVVRAGFAGSVDGCLLELLAHSPNDSSADGIQVVYPRSGTPYTTAPSTPANSTGKQIVTADFLQEDQTMAGAKTFTESVKIKQKAPFVDLHSQAMTAGVTPTSNKYAGVRIYDTAGVEIGNMFYRHGSSGYVDCFLRAYSNDKSTYKDIGVYITKDGSSFGYAPTPAANSNTNHIATTAWVRGKGVLVESWHSGANWYRKYSDGWIEQGGVITWSVNGNDGNLVTLHTPFTDKNYIPQLTLNRETETDQHWGSVAALTTTSFKVLVRWMSTKHKFYWTACGY